MDNHVNYVPCAMIQEHHQDRDKDRLFLYLVKWKDDDDSSGQGDYHHQEDGHQLKQDDTEIPHQTEHSVG